MAARRRSRFLPALVTGAILVLAAAAVGVLILSRTGHGRARLLHLRTPAAFADAQERVEAALVEILPSLPRGLAGPAAPADAVDRPWTAGGDGDAVRCRLVPVGADLTWWELQDALRRTLTAADAQVLAGRRLARPDGAGDVLRLDIGVRNQATHVLALYRERDGRPAAHWGDPAPVRAWQALVGASARPAIAIIIDDWGHSREDDARGLLALDAPLTLAVLPGLPYSRRFAKEATALILPPGEVARSRTGTAQEIPLSLDSSESDAGDRRREILLHLPMEPVGYPDPDPGPIAVMVGMDEAEIAPILSTALQTVATARGVSNHMGSAATADEKAMTALMKLLRRRDLIFVDSLTSDRSVAAAAAKRAGVPVLVNRIFLDHDEPDEAVVRARLETLVASARQRGFAVGIGHPHGATSRVLASEVPRLQADGIRFVTVSELLALQADVAEPAR